MPARKTFENEIQELKDEIIIMGSMVEQAMLDTVDALKKRDIEWSKRIIKQDDLINDKRFSLENRVMIVIATQQPMARDLRVIASILEVISELERMGDYAKGISVINIRMADQPLLKPLIDIPLMAKLGTGMLHRSLSAFVNEDIESAKLIPLEDDEVDQLYNQVYRELMSYVISDASSIERANWLLWAAHNLERFADRVTNICERTVFVETGEYIETKSGPV